MYTRREFIASAAAAGTAAAGTRIARATPNTPVTALGADRFLWGAATAPHQIEGNNLNADLWLAEHVKPTIFHEPSGDACDSYHRYEEDIALLATLGFNTYRLGIEWARIEPEPGLFSIAALDHYRRVLEACHKHGLAPLVTLAHFTFPRWFSLRGGFTEENSPDIFARYATKATESLGDLFAGSVTFNEANLPRVVTLLLGDPKAQALIKAMLGECARQSGSDRYWTYIFSPLAEFEANLIQAHTKATAAIKALRPDLPVGLTLSIQDVQGFGENNKALAVEQMLYGPWPAVAKADDFVGVQTYTRIRVGPEGRIPIPEGVERTDTGFEFYPQSLAGALRYAHKHIGRPIYITENGIATVDDNRRIAFIDGAMKALQECLDEGIDVRGYIHWSWLDNFEWFEGFSKQYGLVAVDRTTFERKLKPSAYHLAAIAKAGVRQARR